MLLQSNDDPIELEHENEFELVDPNAPGIWVLPSTPWMLPMWICGCLTMLPVYNVAYVWKLARWWYIVQLFKTLFWISDSLNELPYILHFTCVAVSVITCSLSCCLLDWNWNCLSVSGCLMKWNSVSVISSGCLMNWNSIAYLFLVALWNGIQLPICFWLPYEMEFSCLFI